VRSRLVPLHSRLGPSLGPLPRRWLQILRQPSGSLAMPRSEDQLADRLPPRSRWRGLGGSPSTRTKARNGAEPWRQSAGGNRGVLVEGVCALAGVFPGPDTMPPWTSWSEPEGSIGHSKTSRRSSTPTAPTTTSTTGRSRHRAAWCLRTLPSRSLSLTLLGDRVQGRPGPRRGGSLNTLSGHALEDSDEGKRQAVYDVICTASLGRASPPPSPPRSSTRSDPRSSRSSTTRRSSVPT
jgi:hypothetical protein